MKTLCTRFWQRREASERMIPYAQRQLLNSRPRCFPLYGCWVHCTRKIRCSALLFCFSREDADWSTSVSYFYPCVCPGSFPLSYVRKEGDSLSQRRSRESVLFILHDLLVGRRKREVTKWRGSLYSVHCDQGRSRAECGKDEKEKKNENNSASLGKERGGDEWTERVERSDDQGAP